MSHNDQAYGLDFLAQLSLFSSEDLFGTSNAEAAGPRLRRRPRKLDEPILRYVAYFHVVTTYQILYRFFAFRGRSPVYGWRLLAQLRDRQLITMEPIYPELGKASMNYIRLTQAGWHYIGIQPQPSHLRPYSRPELEYRLQYAEMMLERGHAGWREVRQEVAFEALRRWALSHYRNRLINENELMIRNRLEQMPPAKIRVPVIAHPQEGQVRIVLPVRSPATFRRSLSDLPSLQLFPTIPFEIVCADRAFFQDALEIIDKHSRRNRYEYTIHYVPHFTDRPNPRTYVAS